MMIDSHFHPALLAAGWQPSEVLVGGLAVTTRPSEWSLALAFVKELSSNWHCALGLHPWFADGVVDWQVFEGLLVDNIGVAIGEIGLDGSEGHPVAQVQRAVFQRQLHYAREYGRLLSLHLVNDREQGYQLIRSMKGLNGGLVHAFTGSLVQAQAWQALGFHLGIGPRLLTPLTDKRRQLLRSLDIRMIQLESDAPLVNSRFQLVSPNELLPYLGLLASVLDLSVESLSQQLYVNWCQLWGVPDE